MRRIVVAVTGASGVIYGLRLLESLRRINDVEVHLVVSKSASKVLQHELGLSISELAKLAHRAYNDDELDAPIASGSFNFQAMSIVPCSMKTLAAIAHGYTSNLITRAADVALKERRRLILLIREAPYSLIHIRNMELVTQAGAIVMPASPPFYGKPKTIDDLINAVVGRVMALMGIDNDLYPVWGS
ncbi:UbiX family flavin prenyltransferase [Caldivirga sp. UBA161]|uniref:UbiX family flavin prenyltransferase n=1 Tax=Caldivirga sp. UBA161 TaxID=1915569 RepID=UPI0025C3FAF8|nr:UbiX family flavin prenyltransferase [Caldivirga sp. UBA161]